MANEGKSEPEPESAALAKVEITGAKIDLGGIEKFTGVFNNAIKALSRGIGAWYEPIGRARSAKADRFVANERAQTIIDLARKSVELSELQKQFGISTDSLQDSQSSRAFSYLIEDASRRQDTREKLIEIVASEIASSPPEKDTDAQIEDDWLTRFWKMAEDISNDQIQLFLARLLAREIVRPGSISPLTLNVLSTLTPHAAARFEHFCRLSIRESNNVYVIHPNVFSFQNIGPLDAFGVNYEDLYELEAYGLIRSAETIMYNFTAVDDASATPINYAGKAAALNFSSLQLHQLRFTEAGKELRELLLLAPVPEYTQTLRDKFGAAFTFDE